MPKNNRSNEPRLYVDVLELGAANAAASVQGDYTPERDMDLSELLVTAWDANGQEFAAENRSSGNTAAGNAVPSLAALELTITEDTNNVPFQKPFRLSLLCSSGSRQRVLPFPIRLYEGSKYKFTVANKGPVNMAGIQFGFPYNRSLTENANR